MAKEEKLVERAKDHLDPGETVLISAMGAYETKIMGQDSIRNGVLIATELRVLFFAKKIGGHEIESFPLKNISSFESGKNLMGGTITFYASNNRVHVKWIVPAASADVFLQVVRKGMHDNPPAAASQPAGVDVLAKIQKLGELHAAGVLTDEEFSNKKAELLTQI